MQVQHRREGQEIPCPFHAPRRLSEYSAKVCVTLAILDLSFLTITGLHLAPLDIQVVTFDHDYGECTWMSSEGNEPIQLLQGTLDMIVLQNLSTMGSQQAYQITTRLRQVSKELLNLNQGTLYPALVRLEQYEWIKGTWGRKESNREAKYYAITKAGEKALQDETQRWRKMAGLVERLWVEES
jgi:PadR family transcriptional regulator PadR